MSVYNVFGAQTYTLATSINSTQTTILLSSFTEPVTGTPYTMALLNTDIVYATIAPRTNSSEFISFTGITQNANGTATLTGVTRGLEKKSPFTTNVAYKLPHSGQSQFIISDAPQVFSRYPVKSNDEHITGQWTFDTFPITPANSDASTTVKGVTKLSVAPVSATEPIAAGTNDPRIPVAYAVDSVGTDAYAITPSPAITAYVAGQRFTFQAGTANTGAATLAVSGLSAISIKKNVTQDLATGDILANQVISVIYDGTNMQLQSRTSVTPVVTTYLNAASPATWTKPSGLKYIIVEVQAAGGSGGAGNDGSNTNGGGGGGGGYSRKLIAEASLGATETITIGAVGENSSFGAHCSATFGTSASGQTPGVGGVGSGGNVNATGGSGLYGWDADNAGTVYANGGNSFFSGGGQGKDSGVGTAGTLGSGGGGGGQSGSAGGGAGGPAIVIVTEYYQ